MELTDSEREEFLALANETFDPGLWSEDEYPVLKAAIAEYEKEGARERKCRSCPRKSPTKIIDTIPAP